MTLTGSPSIVNPNFDHPPENPLFLLQKWLEIADKIGVSESRGLVLSTVNNYNRPSSRVVLMKDFDERGVIFGTSQESAKGKDLELNPYAAGTLWWRETLQQINIHGKVIQLSKEKSDELFQARTREAQAVTSVSNQSTPLTDEKSLKDKILKLMNKKGIIERPERWHAYHLILESIEFWHGGKNRFHKRLRYDLINGSWHYQKLQP